jgi:hypothetical protein
MYYRRRNKRTFVAREGTSIGPGAREEDLQSFAASPFTSNSGGARHVDLDLQEKV